MGTAFIHDDRVTQHNTGSGHPEHSGRITSTLSSLRQQDWFSDLTIPSLQSKSIDAISLIHHPAYLQRIKNSCAQGIPYLDTPDVTISNQSFEAALLSVNLSLNLVDEVLKGSCENGFALTRPPGHHAEKSHAMGFCLLNNIAIAVKYAQQQYGLSKVAIIDWDVHHGNGTQNSFYDDPSVFYASIHQFPFYPGTGRKDECGTGQGRGATLNMPLPAGCNDSHYQDIFETLLLPTLDKFKPEAIFISAGFDAHEKDPLGGMCLSTEIYTWMTLQLMQIAQRHSHGRILSYLEGGYDLKALSDCVQAHLLALRQIDSISSSFASD